MNSAAIDAQLADLTHNAVSVLPEGLLRERLAEGRPLRVKAGFDPTAPDLHLGHAVLLEKLRTFQRWGHEVWLIVGDFTARIGDPTGRNATRPALDPAQIEANAATYAQQAMRILDLERTRVVFNSTWLSTLGAADLIGIAARYNVARMLEREDFSQRHRNGHAIALHEFLYPLLQGYDSVAIQADVELGGTDQTFNLLVGRHLQGAFGCPQQAVLTMPILEGTDGAQKMSKSLGNAIALTEPPDDMFGKVMSVSDPLMWRYYALLGRLDAAGLAAVRSRVDAGDNPRDLKLELAESIVARFHGASPARRAAAQFKERFGARVLPQDLKEIVLPRTQAAHLIGHVLVLCGFAQSTSQALRLVRDRAVRLDGNVIEDPRFSLAPGAVHTLEVGRRRAARVRVEGDLQQGG